MPDAAPGLLGRRRWASTTVIPKLASSARPIAAHSPNAAASPATGRSATSGKSAAMPPTITGRAPNRSASRPPISVPAAPAARSSVSAAFPAPAEASSSRTNQIGTNASRP